MEHFPYGKQIGKILDDIKNRQKRPQAQKPILLGLESEKSENMIIIFDALNFCAEWVIRFSKRAHEVPN